MQEPIQWVDNHMPPSEDKNLPIMSLNNVAKARFFHSSFPPVLRHPPGPAGRHGQIPGAGRPVRQG